MLESETESASFQVDLNMKHKWKARVEKKTVVAVPDFVTCGVKSNKEDSLKGRESEVSTTLGDSQVLRSTMRNC